jgi:hypothetical protein
MYTSKMYTSKGTHKQDEHKQDVQQQQHKGTQQRTRGYTTTIVQSPGHAVMEDVPYSLSLYITRQGVVSFQPSNCNQMLAVSGVYS